MAGSLVWKTSFEDFKIISTQKKGRNDVRVEPDYVEVIDKPFQEFLDLLDLYYGGQELFSQKTSNVQYRGNNKGNSIITAAIVFLNELSADYEIYYDQIRRKVVGQPETVKVQYDLIAINLDELRAMARANTTKEEIAGRFITEIQSNYPEFVERLNAKAAMTFAKGAADFAQLVQTRASEAIEYADKRTREAIAAADTANTTEGIAEAISYWDAKYKNHRKAKWWMFAAFALVLIAGIVVVFFGESLLPGAPGGENGDAGYRWAHYLRVVIVPTLAVAWLLRLISRQFITHLLLQEDARLRQTLVRTFLGLQRNADAEIADKERAHMLEAIFRPLPVTPNGDVNQPSFADIAKVAK